MRPTVYVLGPTPRPVEVDGPVVIGRGADCDLRFAEDRRMSRRHARLLVDADQLHIEDLGGANGTLVNDVPVRGRTALARGDRIRLGKTELRVGDADDAATDAPRLAKPAAMVLAPDLGTMVADDFFAAIGLGDETLLDAKQHGAVVQQSRQLAALTQINRAVQQADDVQTALSTTLDLLLKVLPGDRAFAALVDEAGAPTDVVTRGPRFPGGTGPALSTTLTEYVIRRRTSIISSDASADRRFDQAASLMLSDARALMAAPITQGAPVVGVLGIQSSRLHRRFEEIDLDLLTLVGGTLGLAVAKLHLAEKREQTIAALTQARADLLRTQQELIRTQQLAVIGRLATGIAHEVKNHLSPFMLADMIGRKYPDDEDIQDAKGIMLEARQHILDLVNEVRHFVSGADAAYRLEVVDLAEVVRGVVRFMQCDKVVKEADVQVAIEAEPLVRLDAARFRQVLINLIRNGADAVPDDRRARLHLRVTEADGSAGVHVQDNGRGIPSKVADRIFEPFFTTKGGEGLGLGLDISRKIVAAHDGTLTFTTEADVGTTFSIRLPALG